MISKKMIVDNYYDDLYYYSDIVENNKTINNLYPANISTEKLFYKQIFDSHFPNCSKIVPYFWMPKYTNATDPSARTLSVYNNNAIIDNKNNSDNIVDIENGNNNGKINSMYYYRG